MTDLYSPLEPSQNEIRLIRVKVSGNRNDPIHCTISKHSLNNTPSYQALSYVWGSSDDAEGIDVDGHSISATRNLINFLRELRHQCFTNHGDERCMSRRTSTTGPFWVDAICIDQSNITERNSQVLLMGKIYSQADVTLAWLGEPSPDSDLAMDALESLGKALLATSTDDFSSFQWSDVSHRYVDKDIHSEPFNSIWRSIESLMDRDYWSRAWTFQETVIPKWTHLMCGSVTCLLSHAVIAEHWLAHRTVGDCPIFVNQAVWMCIKQIVDCNMHPLGSIRRAYTHFHAKAAGGIETSYDWDVLLESQGREAKNAHDAVYAFLGVSRLPLHPNYLQPLDQLFLDVAKLGIANGHLETLLCFAAKTDSGQLSSTSLSWVPEWLPKKQGCPSEFLTRSLYVYNANSGMSTSEQAITNRAGQLILTGKTCDIVQHRGLTSVPFSLSTQVLDILQHYQISGEYITGIPLLQAILRTILCDQNGQGSRLEATGWQNHKIFVKLIIFALAELLQSPVDDAGDTTGHLRDLFGLPMDDNFGHAYAQNVLGDASHETAGKTYGGILLPFIAQFSRAEGVEDELARYLSSLSYKSCLFFTQQGYLGTAPSGIQIDDVVVVTHLCRVPLLLRRLGSDYQYIGPCFILGIMDGETFQDCQHQETFKIS